MDLQAQQLPIDRTATEARLSIALHFKLLASLHAIGKLDRGDLTMVASALIVELVGDQERHDMWSLLETMVPGFTRPEGGNG